VAANALNNASTCDSCEASSFVTAMFDRLRKALAPSGGPVTHREIARWAASHRLSIAPQATDGHFELGGELEGRPWRLACGAPTRDYVRGLELRGRADVGADPDAVVMVINRPLKEALEDSAYSALTDTLQTTVDASLPEEMRWLAMYEEMVWPELPTLFRQHFAIVADGIEHAQRWVHAPLVLPLLSLVEGEGGAARAESPLVLMLMHGKVDLRMEHTRRSAVEVEQAVEVLRAATQGALRLLL
jgi:hypothetical protein